MAVLARLAELVDVVTACGHLVDVPLDDASRDHGERRQCETSSDLLDRRELDTHLAETRVDDEIHEWNDNDDEDRVEL